MITKLKNVFEVKKHDYLRLSFNIFLMIILFLILYKFNIFNQFNNLFQIIFKIIIFSAVYIFVDLSYKNYSILRRFYIQNDFFKNFKLIFKNPIKRILRFFFNINNDIQKPSLNHRELLNKIFTIDSEKYREEHIKLIKFKSPKIFLDFGCGIAITFLKYNNENRKIHSVYLVDKDIDYFKKIINNLNKVNKNHLNIYYSKSIDESIKNVDFIFVDAVLMYMNTNNTRKTLKKFFELKPNTILIHDFSYNTFLKKMEGYLYDDKYIKSLSKILIDFAKMNNYKISITESLKKEKTYEKFGYNYLLEKK